MMYTLSDDLLERLQGVAQKMCDELCPMMRNSPDQDAVDAYCIGEQPGCPLAEWLEVISQFDQEVRQLEPAPIME